jgi:hypothetical protein
MIALKAVEISNNCGTLVASMAMENDTICIMKRNIVIYAEMYFILNNNPSLVK